MHFKYAFQDSNGTKKGEIRLCLRPDGDNEITLTVSDNGTGLPTDLDFRNIESLGLQLVNTLMDQLDGNIELDRKDGTTFKMTFAELKYK